jgi:PAS domain S-box-containing protein
MDYKLEDLVDISLLQDLQDKLNVIYSFPSAIIDMDGNILTAVAWQDICTKFHRIHPESEKECIKSDKYILEHLHEANPAVSYKCPHGMTDNATPIIIDGKHLGNFFTGQFFLEKPDIEFFRQQAVKFGFDEIEYLEAVAKVPVWSKKRLVQYLDFIKGFIEIIAGLGLKNLREIESRKALKESEDRYKSLFVLAGEGILTMTPEGKLIEVNESCAAMHGYTVEEMLTISLKDLDTPETACLVPERMKRILQGENITFEVEHYHKNGHVINMEVSAGLITYSGVKLVQCFQRDITEQKKARQQLIESEQRHRTILQTAQDGFWLTDLKGRLLEVNEAYCRMSGFTSEELLTMSIPDLEVNERPEDTAAHIQNVKLNGDHRFDSQHRRKDGTVFDVEVSAQYHPIDGGRIIAFVRDITERKCAEEKLRESEERYRTVIESVSEGIILQDADGRIVTWNPSAERIFGITVEEIIGQISTERNWQVTREDGSVFPATEHPSLITLATGEPSKNVVMGVSTLDGRFSWISINTNPLFKQNDSKPYAVVISFIDITEHKKAEGKIRKSESLKEQMLKNIGDVIVIFDIDGINRYKSPNIEKLFGWKPEEVVGHSTWDNVHPEDLKAGMNFIDSLMVAPNTIGTTEIRYKKKSGIYCWVEITIVNLLHDNDVQGFLGNYHDITERKQAEKELIDSRNLLSSLASQVPGVIYQYRFYPDGSSAFPYSSPGMNEIYEFTPEEVREDATPVFGRLHPEDAARVSELILESARTLNTFYCEFRVVLPRQGLRWRWSQAAPQRTEDGGTLWHGIISDITERKQAEEVLMESEERYSSLFNTMMEGFALHEIICDTKGNPVDYIFLAINQAFEKLTGLKKLEVIGKTVLTVIPATENYWIETYGKVALTGNSIEFENYFEPLGKYFQIKAFSPAKNQFAVLFSDITERKLSEENLRESEERYRTVIESVSEGIILQDVYGRIVTWNPSAERIFGITAEEIIGQISTERNWQATREDGSVFPATEHPSLITLATGEPSKNVVMGVSTLDGRFSWISINTNPLFKQNDSKPYAVVISFIDITERKQAEDALKHSHELLRYIIEHNRSSIAIHDKDLNYIYVSQSYLRDHNVKSTDVLGKHHYEVFPDIPQKWRDVHQRALNGEILGSDEDIFPREDGSIDWTCWECRPWFASDGSVGGIIIYSEVITERKKAEIALRESEANLAEAQRIARIGSWEWDMVTNQVKWSDEMYRVYDIEPENYGSPVELISSVHPDDIENYINTINESIESGTSSKLEYRAIHRDGSVHYIQAEWRIEYGDNRKPIRSIGTAQDITERKQAELLLQKKNHDIEAQYEEYMQLNELLRQTNLDLEIAKAKAEESKQTFKSLIENAPDGVVIIDENGKFKYGSPNAARHFGYNENEIIGHSGDEYTHPEDLPIIHKTFETIMNKPIQKPKLIYRFRRKNGEYRWIETTFTNLLSDKAINGIILNFTDVTERKQILEDLLIAKAKAEESDKLKTAFLQNISHEIRTPLNGILGFSNLLQDDDVSPEEMKEYSVIINQSGNRLLEIVNNVLDISKIETGQLEVRYNTIALNSLVKDLYNFFDPIAGLKGLKLNYMNYLEEKESFISTDDSKLNQVLSNLINNAIKFTNSGTVEFGYEIVADYIQFYVKDTGIGISQDNHKIIFERFTQIDLSITRGFEGAGLGLAISKGLVDLLGGTIWLESEVGRGTVFYFKIPYIATEQNDLPGFGNTESTQNIKKSKILIADDDYTSFVYLSKLLNRDEFTLLYAENGEMALQLVREIRDLDLVIMDIKMPIMDGFQATKEIRLINPDLPVIAQTAYAFREEQDKILSSGFNDYISKPINSNDFLSMINKYLKKGI